MSRVWNEGSEEDGTGPFPLILEKGGRSREYARKRQIFLKSYKLGASISVSASSPSAKPTQKKGKCTLTKLNAGFEASRAKAKAAFQRILLATLSAIACNTKSF